MSTQLLIVLLLIVNIPLFIRFHSLFYQNSAEFRQAVADMFLPGIVSIASGKSLNKSTMKLKTITYFMICGVVVFLEYVIIKEMIDWLGWITIR
ncbi:MAG: hypothetical protein AAFQ94_03055 [Bacteroidota bacterium]